MGGRGRASRNREHPQVSIPAPRPRLGDERASWEWPIDEEWGYSAITDRTVPGHTRYQLFERTGRAWTLVSYAEGLPDGRAWTEVELAQVQSPPVQGAHSFGQAEPTLRWVNGQQIMDLYVQGLDTVQALAAMGLELSLAKGGFVLSKRLSRALRAYRVAGFFPAEAVRIARKAQTAQAAKVWDGGGLVSRALLTKMIAQLDPNLDPLRRTQLARELAHAGRVEFTILTDRGQEKGHAIVVDKLVDDAQQPVDFLLPDDIKAEVKLTSGQTFVGFGFVHGHDHMRLDIQSTVHLHPFLKVEDLAGYLRDEGELFVASIAQGDGGRLMRRIDPGETVADVQQWHLRELVARGGDLRWTGSTIHTVMNQHLGRLEHQTLDKMRLPVPGGRFYVMPAGVGKRGGVRGLHVPRGQIEIDPEHGTAWVNDADWLALPDSPTGAGLAAIWGGADNDDGLWIFPFTDEADGQRKILAWRSPNQVGEYALLVPTAHSFIPGWETPQGIVQFPRADSRLLPTRTDKRAVTYGDVIQPDPTTSAQREQPYSTKAMTPTVQRIRQNQGVLGGFCNTLMTHQAARYDLPAHPPAALDAVIDAVQKTGDNVRPVGDWCIREVQAMLYAGVRFPQRVSKRLVHDRSLPDWALIPPPLKTVGNHWLDQLDARLEAHIGWFKGARDGLVKAAALPYSVFASVFDDPAALALGAKFNQLYGSTMKQLRRAHAGRDLPAEARLATATYLAGFTREEQGWLLRKRLFDAAWRKQAQQGPSGTLTQADYDAALERADAALGAIPVEDRQQVLFDQLYGFKLWGLKQAQRDSLSDEAMDYLRQRMEGFLAQHPPARTTAILRGALVSVALSRRGGRADGVWMPGAEQADGTRAPGIAQLTLQALEELGLIRSIADVVGEGPWQEIAYPALAEDTPMCRIVHVDNGWLGWHQAVCRAQGLPEPASLREVSPAERKRAQQDFQTVARDHLRGQTFEVRAEAGRLVAYTLKGSRVGAINRDSLAGLQVGDQLHIEGALGREGHLHLAVALLPQG